MPTMVSNLNLTHTNSMFCVKTIRAKGINKLQIIPDIIHRKHWVYALEYLFVFIHFHMFSNIICLWVLLYFTIFSDNFFTIIAHLIRGKSLKLYSRDSRQTRLIAFRNMHLWSHYDLHSLLYSTKAAFK